MAIKEKYNVSTIEKCLSILNLFKKHNKLSFSDIQEVLKYNKTSLFRILYTLVDNQYLLRDKNGKYELGLNIFILGNQMSRLGKLKKISDFYLSKLAEEIKLTVHLGIIDGLNVIIVSKHYPKNSSIQMVSRIGSPIPAHCTGQGKVLLAYSPKDLVEKIIKTKGLERYTKNTIDDPEELFLELEKIKARGYSIDNSEHEEHIQCIGFPIFNEFNELEAAVSTTGLSVDFENKEKNEARIKLLKDTIELLRKKIHYNKSDS